MKKVVSLFLAIIMTLGCLSGITAFAASFETENGVQVEMSPFLYKSALYQMEFPSHGDYSVKEKALRAIMLSPVKLTTLHTRLYSLQEQRKLNVIYP